MTETRFVVLLSQARSGTTAVGTVFEQARNYAWIGEVWNPTRWWIPEKVRRTLRAHIQSHPGSRDFNIATFNGYTRANPAQFLGELDQSDLFPQAKYVGLKLLWSDLPPEVMVSEVLSQPSVQSVALIRNPVLTYVSQRKAIETREWRDFDYTHLKPTIDSDHFVGWMRGRRQFIRFLSDNSDFISGFVTYEDLFPGGTMDTAIFEGAMDRIGLPLGNSISAPTTSIQDSETEVRQRVANFDAIESVLGDTSVEDTLAEEVALLDQSLPNLGKELSSRGMRWPFGLRWR